MSVQEVPGLRPRGPAANSATPCPLCSGTRSHVLRRFTVRHLAPGGTYRLRRCRDWRARVRDAAARRRHARDAVRREFYFLATPP